MFLPSFLPKNTKVEKQKSSKSNSFPLRPEHTPLCPRTSPKFGLAQKSTTPIPYPIPHAPPRLSAAPHPTLALDLSPAFHASAKPRRSAFGQTTLPKPARGTLRSCDIVLHGSSRVSVFTRPKTARNLRRKNAPRYTNAPQRWPKMRTKIDHRDRTFAASGPLRILAVLKRRFERRPSQTG